MDLISVVMPVYKEDLNILKQSVCSILKQSYPNVEFIIIVDNPLYKKAIKYLQEIKQMHKNVFVFVNNKNEGIVFSLNKGIKLAHGKYIARMDADDISVDSRLSKELLYLKEGNYDLVGSYYYNIDINSNIKSEVRPPITFDEIKRKLNYDNCVCHPSWLAKRKMFLELDGYRNISSCEDYDFLVRACLRGYKIGNVPQFLLKYRIDSEGISKRNYYPQRIISKLIANKYRENEIVDYEKYSKFIKSNKYNIKIDKYKYMDNLRIKCKRSKGYSKIILLCRLCFNLNFVSEKIIYYVFGR